MPKLLSQDDIHPTFPLSAGYQACFKGRGVCVCKKFEAPRQGWVAAGVENWAPWCLAN